MTGLPMPRSLARCLGRFPADQRGATAIEYALIAGGVAVAIAVAVTTLGNEVKTQLFDKLVNLF